MLAASTDSTTKDSSNSSERSDKLKRREEALLEMRHGWTKALNERIADKENRIQSQVRRSHKLHLKTNQTPFKRHMKAGDLKWHQPQ